MRFYILFFLLPFFGFSQIEEPVEWTTRVEKVSATTYDLIFEATIAPKWHLYSQELPDDGALPTVFLFLDEMDYERVGPVTESESVTDYDAVFEMDLTYFADKAQFKQRIELLTSNLQAVTVAVEYQACDDQLCIFRSEEFTFPMNSTVAVSGLSGLKMDANSIEKTAALKLSLDGTKFLDEAAAKEASNSYWNIFFLGFFGGLLALLTPCVFPMIPLTVSYFLKQSAKRSQGVFNAILYGFFILLIYGLLSLPFHFLDSLNPEILNTISTNVILNIVFFLVFVFFAFSFFGFYELTLPSSWGAKTDTASTWRGSVGIFFMALTLAIVSFSCTGPILGSLLAGSLTAEGGAMQLSVGMLGFGFALGLPFALFAFFPNSLKALPKSGGWMTSVKIVLGFLELALALKFLSNADLVAHWGLLKREVFIGIWLLLSVLLTLYLFGVLRFPHESSGKASWIKRGFAILSLAFCGYLLVGLTAKENKLKLLSGFPPPEFYSLKASESECPLNLDCYKDFESGRAAAIAKNKPILLDFTGWACVNCRKMEENVWSDPKVYSLLKEDYVLISLYVDDRKALGEADQFNFQYPDGRVRSIKTIGQQWATFQAVNFKTASQPFYVLMTAEGQLLNTPIQYTDTTTYYEWLRNGLDNIQPKQVKYAF